MHTESPATEAPSPPPPDAPVDPGAAAPPPDPCVVLLERFLEQARLGKLRHLVIGYLTADNDANVRSTPMPAAVMNHLHRLIDRRVDHEYDRQLRLAEAARTPGTQPARVQQAPERAAEPDGPETIPPLPPRVVKRMVKKAKMRAEKRVRKVRNRS